MQENVWASVRWGLVSPSHARLTAKHFVPRAELRPVDGRELVTREAVAPVAFWLAGGVEARITAVEKQVLDGQNQQTGMAGKHGAQDGVVAVIPVAARVTAVGKKPAAGCLVQRPHIAQERIVVVRAGIGYTVVGIVMRQVG